MDPCPPECVRVVISCRACGGEDTLDLQACTPERLREVWTHCAGCGSPAIEIEAANDVSSMGCC